jgi:hypothetical protein
MKRFRRSLIVDEEREVDFSIWQKIVNGQMLWIAEIVDRLEVKIRLETSGPMLRIDGPIGGENNALANTEIDQMLDSVELLYYNICIIHGDPCKRRPHYRKAYDLWDREPLQAIVDEALTCIDVALIGPLDPAAALLAADERLYDSAKTRALYSTPTEAWPLQIRKILARSDSLIAQRAIDGVLHAG